jgi:GntR family transcriptional regulator
MRKRKSQTTVAAEASASPSLLDRLVLRTDTAMPIYRQLEDQLAALIQDGSLAAGTTLPAERQLSASLGVSRTTVQRVYDSLRKRRMLAAHGRLGTIVQKPEATIEPGMNRLKGFTEEMAELGREPSSRIVERRITTDRGIAAIFGRPSTMRLLKLVRVRLGDGIPLAREVGWYDVDRCPGLEHADLSGSVYAYLADNGARLSHCEQTIEATSPDAEECDTFGFAAPLPCLLIKRRSFDRDQRLVEYVEGLFRGDAYAYRLAMSV